MIYGIIGCGGHGREIMAMLMLQSKNKLIEPSIKFVFVAEEVSQKTVDGCPVLTLSGFLSLDSEKKFCVAIGNSMARERIANICLSHSIEPFSFIAPGSLNYSKNSLGEGTLVSSMSIIHTNVLIGKFSIINSKCNVSHDCIIHDYVTLSPGVLCNGNVTIEHHAFIGAGAMIINGSAGNPTVIGEGAIVGMGAVVTNSVEPYTTVVGNPARPTTKRL